MTEDEKVEALAQKLAEQFLQDTYQDGDRFSEEEMESIVQLVDKLAQDNRNEEKTNNQKK
ncbi:hypothetical protein FC40_GL001580 [Ligilactobacillus hayakitensis DSM 18933 = JCM 14209]|uniref:Uncharacterized protein n=1 Tax=Ligilactobacillus hayakitensis DSM 18933 = JCM 14209 TaxID=1423755 RepID=A0A0R1WZB6_9LACO|nr:hypothetical protein [Ligilactobacillus hayakitensis]KRM19516.1 hypothetical protein FC40_GL001580 [Ligilactobacillus hayakitensis DSM 18933 = JCM 14209]